MILNHVWLRVQVATIDRRMITHFRESQDFLCGDFFVSSVSSHSIFVRDNSKLVFFLES